MEELELETYLREKGVDVHRGAGQELVMHCLWCPDGDPKGKGKCYLNAESWLYQCKRCDARGNRKTLLEYFGDTDTIAFAPGEDPSVRRQLLSEYVAKTEELLSQNEGMLLYLLRRGLSAETIEKARLGYAPRNVGVCDSLPTSFNRAACIGAGLVTQSGKDFLQNRITIPYFSSGAVVQIRGKDPEGKYVTPTGNNARLYNIDALRDADRVIITEGEMDCFSGDTEILTPRGWARFDQYEVGPVAQYEADGSITFVEPMARTEKDADRVLRLYTHRRGGIDLVVTPGHRMVSTLASGAGLKIHRADERPSGNYHVPRVGVLDGSGIDYSEDEIALLLAVAADATVDHRLKSGVNYVRFGLSKERKIVRLRRLLTDLGIEFSDAVMASGVTSICFRLPSYLPAFKQFPMEWLVQASEKQREFILAEMVQWDGNSVISRSQDEFATRHLADAEWMQTLAHTTGRVATIMRRTNEHGSWFKVSILHEKRSTSWQAIQTEELPGQRVYCVQVPSGMLLVRRNEMVAVSGNCLILQQHLSESPDAVARSIAVVGVPGANALPENFERYFTQAKRVYIGLDSDETGRAAAIKLKTLLGTKSRIVELPREYKDWTDYIVEGHNWQDVMRLIQEADLTGKRLFSMVDAGHRWEKNQIAVPGIKTGFATFDEIVKPGLRPGNLMIPLAKTGVGKGHPLSTDVATPDGWRKWGDLAAGDYVFGSDGEPTRVVAVWDRGVLPTYRVNFSDRTSVVVDADHIWEVQYRTGKDRGWQSKTLNTAELMASDLRVGVEYRFRIPMAQPVEYPTRDYDVDPYTLGALIANGSLKGTTAALTTPDREVVDRISSAHKITETKSEACPRFTVRKAIGALRRMGLAVGSADKFIPAEYLLGSVQQRLALLQGLMDGDGSTRKPDGRRAVQYFTSSPKLAANLRELVASLGGTAMERWSHRDGARPEGVLSIMLPDGMEPFSTSRKVRGETRYKTGPRRCITSIEPMGAEEIRCITVDAPDSLYLIGKSYTVTHNTLFLSNLAYNMRSRRVLFITLEMMADEIYAIMRKISRFHNPRLDDAEIQAQMPYLRIVDENRLSAEDFALLIEEYREDVGEQPEIVFVDYLGYYSKGQRGGSPYEKTSNAVMQLKEEAKRHEVAIIAPHQVNRGAKEGKPLDADEARDSGVVEETGDFVVGLFKPGDAVEDGSMASGKVNGAMGMSVLKSRRGGKGKVVQLHMSMASLAIVDDTDRKLVARVQQENARLNQGENYDDLYREQRRAADASAQLRLVKDTA